MLQKPNGTSMNKRTIGRTEMIDFPSLDWIDVPCCVDTGAYRSSMHCDDIHMEEDDAGQKVLVVTFQDGGTHPPQRFTTFDQALVRSSNGSEELRYIVTLPLRIFGTDFSIAFTLANRTSMKFPVLLGRTFLRQGFIVDVRRTNLSKKSQA